MKYVPKKIAFALLLGACIISASLLFFPEKWDTTEFGDDKRKYDDNTATLETSPTMNHGMQMDVGDEEWNTYHGNNALQGVADASFPDALRVLWRLPAAAPVRQTPVIWGESIYAVTARSEVLAVTFDGKITWRQELASMSAEAEPAQQLYIDAPIAVFEGKVFVGTDDGTLLALCAKTGEILWRSETGGVIRGTPNYTPETNTVVVLDQETGAMFCLNANTGSLVWRSPEVDRTDGSPAIENDAAVYGSCASALHVLSTSSGAHVQDIKIEEGGGQIAGGAALLQGLAYAGCRDGRVLQADVRSGKLLWIRSVSEAEVFATPAVRDNWVITASLDGKMHALNAKTGDLVWQQNLGNMPLSPVIAGEKVIVSSGGTVYFLNLQDGSRLWDMHLADEITGPAVISNLIVVGCEDGTLAALAPEQ